MIDLDHVSFGTKDALQTARNLRATYGATAVFGETLPEFRYLLLFLGTPQHGGFLELLDSNGPGFMTKFLDKHGEAPHHITFTVPDLKAAVAHAQELGFTVTGENYEHESWREAFIVPNESTGCVIQLAQTPHRYPSPAELLATNERNVALFASSQGAIDNAWWLPIWDTPPGSPIQWHAVATRSKDVDTALALYRNVLGANVTYDNELTTCTWPGGSITIRPSDTSGIDGASISKTPDSTPSILNPSSETS